MAESQARDAKALNLYSNVFDDHLRKKCFPSCDLMRESTATRAIATSWP
jgi:hypothetical protein